MSSPRCLRCCIIQHVLLQQKPRSPSRGAKNFTKAILPEFTGFMTFSLHATNGLRPHCNHNYRKRSCACFCMVWHGAKWISLTNLRLAQLFPTDQSALHHLPYGFPANLFFTTFPYKFPLDATLPHKSPLSHFPLLVSTYSCSLQISTWQPFLYKPLTWHLQIPTFHNFAPCKLLRMQNHEKTNPHGPAVASPNIYIYIFAN